MSDQFVAEIRIFAGNFAPIGWAFCNGQLMPISQNTALFSLLGTTYGGDGKSTFALPDLQGRAPMHPGQGPGLSLRDLGESDGQPAVTLLESELPLHSHGKRALTTPATAFAPSNTDALARSVGGNAYAVTGSPEASLDPTAIQPAGGSQPHDNMQPFLVLNFIIALQGIFPPRGN
jgi:microcystin-dependent protein